MVSPLSMDVNDFIQRQLDERAKALEQAFDADILCVSGDIVGGVDDLIRPMVESLKGDGKGTDRLIAILTTGGGYIEVVHRIVDTLRYNYSYVGFVVPNYALSAGTVLVMSGDAIYMDYYSRLGPIDPQLENSSGRLVPALGYLVQWERLLEKAQNNTITLPEIQLMINGFDQAELYQYEQARELSITLLKEWLVKYKFKNWTTTESQGINVTEEMRQNRAVEIANILNDTDRWHTHDHGISMEVLRRDINLKIDDFGQDPDLREKIKNYHSLFADYMTKTGNQGAIHRVGSYLPYSLGG